MVSHNYQMLVSRMKIINWWRTGDGLISSCVNSKTTSSLLLFLLFRKWLKAAGISAVFHYVPLHDSPFGKSHGRVHGDLPITRMASDCLLRLPLWLGVEAKQQRILDELTASIN